MSDSVKTPNLANDLELNEEYFQNDSSQTLLQKTVQDVHNVLSMAQNGQTIPEIARALHLEEQYVYNIQISAQGFQEDDEIAVAHLVMMG